MAWRREEEISVQEEERATEDERKRVAPAGPPAGIWTLPTERWDALSSTPHLQTSFLPVTLRWGRGLDEAPACLGVPSTRAWGPSRKPEKEGHRLTSECAHSQLWAQDRGLPAGVRGQVKVPRRQPAGLGGVGRDRGEAPGRMEEHNHCAGHWGLWGETSPCPLPWGSFQPGV